MQHRLLYDAKTDFLKNDWLILTLTKASRSFPSSKGRSSLSISMLSYTVLFFNLARISSLRYAKSSQFSLNSCQTAISPLPPCRIPEIFLFCRTGSSLAKLSSLSETDEGVRPSISANSLINLLFLVIFAKGILQYKLNATINSSRVQFLL